MIRRALVATAVALALVTGIGMATVEEDGSGRVAGVSYCLPLAACSQ